MREGRATPTKYTFVVGYNVFIEWLPRGPTMPGSYRGEKPARRSGKDIDFLFAKYTGRETPFSQQQRAPARSGRLARTFVRRIVMDFGIS